MGNNKKGHLNKLDLLINGLGDSLLEMSDEEYTLEAQELGINIEKDSHEVKQILRDADKNYRLRNLHKANGEYKQKISLLKNISNKFDLSIEKAKSILVNVIKENSELSLQFRNLEGFTEEDINSLLSQFIHLGLLDEEDLK